MRGDVLALSDGRNPIAFALVGDMIDPRTLCIYVDESGNFGDVRDSSRYCMVTLVFQDETAKNSVLEREYGDAIFRLGADPESMVFHSAPLIRQEDQFSAMSRNMRGKLIGLRLAAGLALNLSEQRFFGSPRTFERNILGKIKSKEI